MDLSQAIEQLKQATARGPDVSALSDPRVLVALVTAVYRLVEHAHEQSQVIDSVLPELERQLLKTIEVPRTGVKPNDISAIPGDVRREVSLESPTPSAGAHTRPIFSPRNPPTKSILEADLSQIEGLLDD